MMYTAVGLMSGTSLDGVDAALVQTDGEHQMSFGPALTRSYGDSFRGHAARDLVAPDLIRRLTDRHVAAVEELLHRANIGPADVQVIGFPGQTVAHAPAEGWTWQVGDAGRLAAMTGIRVVSDFRSRDLAHGGEGAPLAPLFHQALTASMGRPLAVLNLGGVANVTWLGRDGAVSAFDTGPGCAPLDDHVRRVLGTAYDRDGRLAAEGSVPEAALAELLRHPYFGRPPPKSLDRDQFGDRCAHISHAYAPADAAALLTAFCAAAVAQAQAWMPERPATWLVTGGGRRNPALMAELRRRLTASVDAVESVGLDGDALEAQAFGWLAVRSLRGLPLAVPATTGVRRPLSGGVLVYPGQAGVRTRLDT